MTALPPDVEAEVRRLYEKRGLALWGDVEIEVLRLVLARLPATAIVDPNAEPLAAAELLEAMARHYRARAAKA